VISTSPETLSLYVSFTRVEIGSTVEEPETLTLPEIASEIASSDEDELSELLSLEDDEESSSPPPHAAATIVRPNRIAIRHMMRLFIRTVFLLL
jgi:hypothetical protein